MQAETTHPHQQLDVRSKGRQSSQEPVKKVGWRTHAAYLPGSIKPVSHPSPGSLSHVGIGLGAGILGGRYRLHPDTTTESEVNAAKAHEEERMNILRKGTEMSGNGTLGRKGTMSKAELIAEKTKNEEAAMMADIAKLNSMSIRFTKFKTLLDMPVIDLEQLRKLSWAGIPDEIRSTVWKLLMGYLPSSADRRDATLRRKRKEYEEYVAQSFGRGKATLDQGLYHQIHIDVQRTHATVPLYQNARIQEALEHVLYCWAIRHPASGYVQGINDLVTPFFHVYLQSHIKGDVEQANLENVTPELLTEIEADSFWCLTKLLDGIQDNYTHAQPGIQRQIVRLKELINRIDARLYAHLQSQGVEFIQFAFRWMNCLLMRELSLRNIIRMWDSYQAEGTDGFSDFHLYVCAAFLVKWTEQLRRMEFQDLMMFLQSLPTQNWEDKEIELLLSEAYMWKSLFHNSPSHLAPSSGTGAS